MMSFFAMEIWCLGWSLHPENLWRKGATNLHNVGCDKKTRNSPKFASCLRKKVDCILRSTAIRNRFGEYSVELWKLMVFVGVSTFCWSVWYRYTCKISWGQFELTSYQTHSSSSIRRYTCYCLSFFRLQRPISPWMNPVTCSICDWRAPHWNPRVVARYKNLRNIGYAGIPAMVASFRQQPKGRWL